LKFHSRQLQLVLLANLIGLGGFVLIAGHSSFDPQNMSWVNGGLDPATHFFGWEFFRQSSWGLPIGINPNFGMELSNSIVFSDSLPLLAIFFKTLHLYIPKSFQYFGIYTAISFILISYFSIKIISLFSNNLYVQAMGSCIVLFYPPMLAMVGTYTALSSHYLILAALYLALKKSDNSHATIYWIILICLSALVHFYLLVMVFCVWVSTLVDQLSVGRGRMALRLTGELFFIVVILSVVLWLVGNFSISSSSGSASGYGFYRTNILSFFTPNGWSFLINSFPLKMTNGEEFNFLGLGGVIGLLFIVFSIFLSRQRWLQIPFFRYKALIACLLFFLALSITNNVGFGPWVLNLSSHEIILYMGSFVRASGRFIWPISYLILFGTIYCICQLFSQRVAILILCMLAFIQILDSAPGWQLKRHVLSKNIKEYVDSSGNTSLINPFWRNAASHYSKLVRVPAGNIQPGWDIFANLASKNEMATTSVFLARFDTVKASKLNDNLVKLERSGGWALDTLYILEPWKANPRSIAFNPDRDLLAEIDGWVVLAPGWMNCSVCPPLIGGRLLNSFMPSLAKHDEIIFTPKFDSKNQFLVSGWSVIDESWGVWADKDEAVILLPPIEGLTAITFIGNAFVSAKHPEQRIEISINEVHNKSLRLQKSVNNSFTIEGFDSSAKFHRIKLSFPDAASPKSLGINEDTRKLSFGLVSLQLQ